MLANVGFGPGVMIQPRLSIVHPAIAPRPKVPRLPATPKITHPLMPHIKPGYIPKPLPVPPVHRN